MKDIILTNYAVKGIKNLSEWARISFYKSSGIKRPINSNGYNVKGIYGENGAGKSGLITSVDILREIIIDPNYITDSFVQKRLHDLINKKLESLEYEVEFIVDLDKKVQFYCYELRIEKDKTGRYVIKRESLKRRNAFSHSNDLSVIYRVENGKVIELNLQESIASEVRDKSKNLLMGATLVSVCCDTFLATEKGTDNVGIIDFIVLFLFAFSFYVYLDVEDEHTDYYIKSAFDDVDNAMFPDVIKQALLTTSYKGGLFNFLLQPNTMTISKADYGAFEKQVAELKRFLKIFKSELVNIKIDKSIDKKFYKCKLLMVYDDYSVDAEFESTGIKKLIKIFAYLKKMVEGEIVFIDELDSNLHDVYLCALLEYLMQYGKGQLCFTSHNIGPMDVLKKNKKSLDFLSADQTIHSWSKSGNYSPSKLYREGMIAGSPFNVDSIDFLGVFDESMEE